MIELRGFMYTIIVLVLALSFMYLVISENSLPPIQDNHDPINEIKNSYLRLYKVNIIDGTDLHIQGKTGERINIGEYENIARNYGIMRNHNISVFLQPDFNCNDWQFGYESFKGDSWYTEINHNTDINITLTRDYTQILKNVTWSNDGYEVMIRVRDKDENIVVNEYGKIDANTDNEIIISYSDGEEVVIDIKNSKLRIKGDSYFSEMVYNADCAAKNNGYVLIDGIKKEL